MFVRIDHSIDEPLYMQIRSQVIAGIARGELAAGDALPSVRRLASDLGINLHTVNKAYAVLRDEGYIEVRGRSGAFVVQSQSSSGSADAATSQMASQIYGLAMAYRARGGTLEGFLEQASQQAKQAFEQTGAASVDVSKQ